MVRPSQTNQKINSIYKDILVISKEGLKYNNETISYSDLNGGFTVDPKHVN